MIKVNSEQPKKNVAKPFPKLVKFTYPSGHACILLMKDEHKGTVLHMFMDPNTDWIIRDEVGNLWNTTDAYPCGFTDYNEPITIQNA